ncbi:hypothetical protein CDL12_05510 [Handroanthus impetiginosus]|uniref:Uncharacterized protein n=1 Tax=Handroanthus impetiginosus TaxID=429701 RepID=A0A2G9HW91_9LAMI|nr:hypothetical protein CDL12_05510 [Handroanthus impetiginosus]
MKGVLNEADLGRLNAYPPDDALEMLSADLARMEKRHALELEKAKEEALRSAQEKEQLLERYTRDVKMGKKFMESEAGRAALEEAVNKFKGSEEFEELVLDRAEGIYEQTVQDCHKILQGTGTRLPLNFARDGRMVGARDAEDGVDGHDPPPRLSVLSTSFIFLSSPAKGAFWHVFGDTGDCSLRSCRVQCVTVFSIFCL